MGVYIKARFNYDPDALAFIQASSIPNTTQKLAVNQLVLDLKAYGIWSKMKAIYPMVGGSAFYHKWNLKDPRDLDAAFRLVFLGGWTHSSTGALPNGTNGYANTNCNMSTNYSVNTSVHISYYSRTDGSFTSQDMAVYNGTTFTALTIRRSAFSNQTLFAANETINYSFSGTDPNGAAFYISNRTALNVNNGWRNGIKVATGTNAAGTRPSLNMFLANININGAPDAGLYGKREVAFSSIGDGLTDTEAANFYTAVQAYQVALGRTVGPQTVSDADAQAFINAAVIEDQIQATAVNQLVIDMKAANIWTKMKAIYPFVGGTAASHKWNLKNPLDTNAAFRLTFTGGWTHSSTGALPNGTNGYADTFATKTIFTNNNLGCQGAFMTAQSGTTIRYDFGIKTTGAFFALRSHNLVGNNTFYNGFTSGVATNAVMQNLGFIASSRIANNDYKTIIQDGSIISSTTNDTTAYHTSSFYIGNTNTLDSGYSNREFRFYFLSDPLSSTELTNFRTAVVLFNTTLNRQV